MSRARSFGSVAELYDRSRPSPPPEASTVIGEVAGLDVVEVAAGTGLVTRYLLSRGARVTAVEPDEQMRAVLGRRTPGARVLDGVAESLPVAAESADVVVTSSAWHWFTQPDAADEIARVLRDEGRLVILGNGLDREHPWFARLDEIARVENPGAPAGLPRHAHEADDDLVEPFDDVEGFRVPWTWRRTTEEVLGLLQTYSAFIALEPEARERVLSRARVQLVEVAPAGVLDVPMVLNGVRARRRAR